jgi:hypothetical protein
LILDENPSYASILLIGFPTSLLAPLSWRSLVLVLDGKLREIVLFVVKSV